MESKRDDKYTYSYTSLQALEQAAAVAYREQFS